MRLLSLEGYATEESILALISCDKVQNLEIFKLKYELLKVNFTKLKPRLKLKNLKRLDLRGCIIKFDESDSNFANR